MKRIETNHAIYLVGLRDTDRKIYNVVRKSKRTLKERRFKAFEPMVKYWERVAINIKNDESIRANIL